MTLVQRVDRKAERHAGPFESQWRKAERAFAKRVALALQRIKRNVARRLREEYVGAKELGFKRSLPSDEKFWRAQRKVLFETLAAEHKALLQQGVRQAERLGLSVSFDLANETVDKVAAGYIDEWWQMLSKTTRDGLRSAIQDNIQSGESLTKLIRNIEPIFGEDRAQLIASTEVTRMYAEGNMIAYEAAGVDEWEWQTANDDRVDTQPGGCADRAGQRYGMGDPRPPAHPGCRCWPAAVANDRPLKRVV